MGHARETGLLDHVPAGAKRKSKGVYELNRAEVQERAQYIRPSPVCVDSADYDFTPDTMPDIDPFAPKSDDDDDNISSCNSTISF